MNKILKKAVMLCMFMLFLCAAALATESGIKNLESTQAVNISIRPLDSDGKAITSSGGFYAGASRLQIECTGVQDGEAHLLLIMNDDTGIPTKDNLYYINVEDRSGDDSAIFDVYPKDMQAGTYEIWVTNDANDGAVVRAATFTYQESGSVKLGDVNDSGTVDLIDALAIMRHDVGLSGYDLTHKKDIADINRDDKIDLMDALIVMRHDVGLLDIEEVYGS